MGYYEKMVIQMQLSVYYLRYSYTETFCLHTIDCRGFIEAIQSVRVVLCSRLM